MINFKEEAFKILMNTDYLYRIKADKIHIYDDKKALYGVISWDDIESLECLHRELAMCICELVNPTED